MNRCSNYYFAGVKEMEPEKHGIQGPSQSGKARGRGASELRCKTKGANWVKKEMEVAKQQRQKQAWPVQETERSQNWRKASRGKGNVGVSSQR